MYECVLNACYILSSFVVISVIKVIRCLAMMYTVLSLSTTKLIPSRSPQSFTAVLWSSPLKCLVEYGPQMLLVFARLPILAVFALQAKIWVLLPVAIHCFYMFWCMWVNNQCGNENTDGFLKLRKAVSRLQLLFALIFIPPDKRYFRIYHLEHIGLVLLMRYLGSNLPDDVYMTVLVIVSVGGCLVIMVIKRCFLKNIAGVEV